MEAELRDEGRTLVRESGAGVLIRVMVEARSHEICKEKLDKVVKVLERKKSRYRVKIWLRYRPYMGISIVNCE